MVSATTTCQLTALRFRFRVNAALSPTLGRLLLWTSHDSAIVADTDYCMSEASVRARMRSPCCSRSSRASVWARRTIALASTRTRILPSGRAQTATIG
jgi:hypothetical protein